MSYFVNWKLSVEEKLAAIWVDAPDRASVSEAARTIEEMLRRSPATLGEQIDAERRIVIEHPLAVVFKVLRDDLRVDVIDVKFLS